MKKEFVPYELALKIKQLGLMNLVLDIIITMALIFLIINQKQMIRT
jgi:hypothetical protein